MTAVHEVGHWAGLYHTFQGGCEAPGDDIVDTAYEQNAATGCPLRQPSACPGETRFDPVENYMDYSDDSCMKQFTPLQYQRIKDMVGYYRYQAEPADEPVGAARANPQKHRVKQRLVLLACLALGLQRQSCACLQEHRGLRHRRLRRAMRRRFRSRPSAGSPIATAAETILGAAPADRRIDAEWRARRQSS